MSPLKRPGLKSGLRLRPQGDLGIPVLLTLALQVHGGAAREATAVMGRVLNMSGIKRGRQRPRRQNWRGSCLARTESSGPGWATARRHQRSKQFVPDGGVVCALLAPGAAPTAHAAVDGAAVFDSGHDGGTVAVLAAALVVRLEAVDLCDFVHVEFLSRQFVMAVTGYCANVSLTSPVGLR